jgi:3'(2'), 5'-bisphosphate nucleotidase
MNADDFARLQPIFFGARRLRITGCTALDVCLTASGSLHGFVNANRFLNPIWGEKIVDYAGAALVLEEVGGALCDQAGRPLDYPLDLQHRLCLQAAAGPSLLAELIAGLGSSGEEGKAGGRSRRVSR